MGMPITGTPRVTLLQALGVVLVGLVGRALIDKLLVLRGGAELVAHWAQLTSLADLVLGVTLAGIGTGLTGRIAALPATRHRSLLNEALRFGLAASALGLLAGAALLATGHLVSLPPATQNLVLPALVVGWLGVAPGLLSAWLLGRSEPGRATLLSAAMLGLMIAGLALADPGHEMAGLLAGQALGGLALTAFLLRGTASWSAAWRQGHELRPFIVASLAIGILSPAATAFARQEIANAASWQTAGAVQALWRSSEWITAIAAGVLSAHSLPHLAAATDRGQFIVELRRAAQRVLLPSLLCLALAWLYLPQLLALLYRDDLPVTRADALPFFIGDGLRMTAWIFLFGLFARGAGRAVTLGEFLSLPLFAGLLLLAPVQMELATIGLCWLAAYACYAAFNAWALLRRERGVIGPA